MQEDNSVPQVSGIEQRTVKAKRIYVSAARQWGDAVTRRETYLRVPVSPRLRVRYTKPSLPLHSIGACRADKFFPYATPGECLGDGVQDRYHHQG